MADQNNKGHERQSGQKAGAELEPGEIGSYPSAKVNHCAKPDQGKGHDDLHDARDHTREGSRIVSAARVGFELASIVRQADTGVTFEVPEINKIMVRLLEAPASTPLDALALAVSATKLAYSVKRSVDDHLGEGDRGMADVMVALLSRTIEALEVASGTSAAVMSGERPVAN